MSAINGLDKKYSKSKDLVSEKAEIKCNNTIQ